MFKWNRISLLPDYGEVVKESLAVYIFHNSV